MNPFQKNKVDMNALNPEEQKAFRMYGKLPNRKDVLQNKLKERKYFDSGDYALSKAGKTSEISPTDVGHEHPVPENIPHLSSSPSQSGPGVQPGSGGVNSPPGGPPLSPENTPRGSISVPSGGQTGDPGAGVVPGNSAGVKGNHLESARQGSAGSPVKEASWLQRETSVDEAGIERTSGPMGQRRSMGQGQLEHGMGSQQGGSPGTLRREESDGGVSPTGLRREGVPIRGSRDGS